MYILSQDKTRIYNMSGHIEGIGYKESKDYKQRKSENIRHPDKWKPSGGSVAERILWTGLLRDSC